MGAHWPSGLFYVGLSGTINVQLTFLKNWNVYTHDLFPCRGLENVLLKHNPVLIVTHGTVS